MWSGEGTGESNELLMKRKLGIGRNLQTSVELLPTTYSRASEIGQTSGLRLYGTECFYPAPHALESTTGRGTYMHILCDRRRTPRTLHILDLNFSYCVS